MSCVATTTSAGDDADPAREHENRNGGLQSHALKAVLPDLARNVEAKHEAREEEQNEQRSERPFEGS